VRLQCEPGDAQLRLSIVDTGCGMDEATLARIFEPFFTTKQVGEGTGLGLSVADGIIKDHGGRIDVASKPGEGTRFDILLPVARAAVGAAA
jgi:signal transduction histidine kinase